MIIRDILKQLSMNDNIEYEKFVQEIYQGLLIEEGITNSVQHNIKLQGKFSKHQVDVYWEYRVAGINQRVAIECKNYNKELSIGKVRDFYSVLNDIGHTKGVMVTKIGYQRGAKEFAERCGIDLVVVRKPQADDWNGRLKTIVTNVEAITQVAKKWFVLLDYDWCKQSIPNEEINLIEAITSGLNYEIWIYDNNGNQLKNFLQLQDELPFDENSLIDNAHIYEFEDAYIASQNHGNIKIKSIHITYDTSVSKAQWTFDSQEITKQF